LPGQFSKSARPARPGAYFNFEAVSQAAVLPSSGLVVAVPITHDWGPMKTVVRVGSLQDFKSVFGPTETSKGFKAIKQVFQGEGLPGSGGAGEVLVFRMGAAGSMAKATKTLQNTTPAAAITLTAKYEGDYGEQLKVTTQDYASDATKEELIIYVGTVEVERYRYADTNITDLAAQINANSDWVTAGSVTSGVALAHVASQAFTGGDDGATLTATEWTEAMDAFAPQRFSVFVPQDLTDSGILASLQTWVENANVNGQRFMAVIGGAADEDAATAISRAATLADENFVCLGVGSVVDDALGALSTSELAPRIAGILASFADTRSLTYARLAGLSLVGGASASDIVKTMDAGVVVLSLGSDPVAPVRIEVGRTTWISTADPQKPYLIFRQPKYVRTMHLIQTELQEWADINVVGKLPVNNKTRDFVIGEVARRLKLREEAGAIQSGWTVTVDPTPPPTADDEFIAVLIGIAFGRSSEQVFFTTRIA
jgi:hypothetical protein